MNNKLNTIAVDLTPILPGGENGGAKVFILELLRTLADMKPQTDFILMTQEASHEELSALDCANMRRVLVRTTSAGPAKPNHQLAEGNILPLVSNNLHRTARRLKKSLMKRLGKCPINTHSLLKDMGVDLLFCPFTAPTYYEPEIPVVSTIYDLQYKTYPEFFGPYEVIHRNKMFMDACQKATLLTAISDYSRKSAIQHGKLDQKKIRTIYLQMAQRITYKNNKDLNLLNKLGVSSNSYLLYPANFWKHKNHEVLLQAFSIAQKNGLASHIKLICTGAPDVRQKLLMNTAINLNLNDHILFPGYLNNEEFGMILANCAGMIFPSLYEGFGLPVIEAMAAGVPVACSNTRSLPEVVDNAALLFDPCNPTQIAKALTELVTNNELRDKLIQEGKCRAAIFSDSRKMAKEYWELFQNALEIKKNHNQLSGVWSNHIKVPQEISSDSHQNIETKAPSSNYSDIKISIVTPSFNQGQYIERTLLSVLKQNWPAYEHIIFDGGSTDNTIEILKKYNDKIKWVSEKDKGQTNAINKAIRVSDGDIIGWLNSDDIYYPNCFTHVVDFFIKNPDIDIVYGAADHIDVNDLPFETYPTECWDYNRLLDHCFICQPAVFFRRTVIDKYGLLDDSLHYCMDYEYWLRIGKAGILFAHIEEKLAGSRLYKENKTMSAKLPIATEINCMLKGHFGIIPDSWLKHYARTVMHDHSGNKKPIMPNFQFNLFCFLTKIQWSLYKPTLKR